jgi:NAD(P)-dependent dehydrogenase (short-subunit alcohol dehydrogenase family)
MTRPVTVVAGIGEGLGLSLAKVFAADGFDVIGMARTSRIEGAAARMVSAAGASYQHHLCDLASAQATAERLAPVAERIEVVIYAAHALLIRPVIDTTSEAFESVWRTGCLGAFNAVSPVIPDMAKRGRGALVFIGATAGVRGGATFAAFASAKFALRGLAQSLARELGPKGIHVAHIIVDGLIDEPQTEGRFGAATSTRIPPDEVAANCLALVRQPPSAWTHELDLRPSTERF